MDKDQAALDAERRKAGEAAVKAERERVSSIKAAFPKDPQFAIQQIEAGADLLTAKAAYADKLQADLDSAEDAKKKAEAEVAKLQAGKGSGGGKSGPDPVNFAGGEGGAEGGKDFLQLAEEHASAHKCTIQRAMSEVARRNPEVHQAYVEQQRSRPARKIERAPAK